MRHTLLSVALATLVSTGCATAPLTVSPETDFTLKVRESATLQGANISVRVDSVVGDSRCPVNATCVWAGNAAIWLLMSRDNEPGTSLTLNSDVEPRSASFAGRTIAVVGLEPLPSAPQKLTQDQYRVRLRFSQ